MYKIEQVNIKQNEHTPIKEIVEQLSNLSNDENIYIMYYTTYSIQEQEKYGIEDHYCLKSLLGVWYFDDDPFRRERIARRVADGKACLIRITY